MAEERLQPISLHQEMQRSYLEYAMSVIVGRALPDVRDGLKPVQRRILYAMHELGLNPDRPYRKCARVVGDVLGKYHPHGDQAVYDALVRLVQDFASRYPVLDGHGNFGSVDDDPPAAMRYTETRLAPIAHRALLDEIGYETVDFLNNFDGSQQEPSVLPAQLPFLLLNGCTGIAVGMATSIPPHNLNEIVDGLIALIRKPELSDEKLLEIIPGPDFPTGGEILLGTGVKETYLKGKGSIPMRGMSHIEETQPGKGKHKRTAIVITELPYQLSKAGWIEKLAEQVNEGKIGGIADIRDESDREGMRILVELRRDTDPEKVINDLQRKTALQNNFGAILLAIVDGQPKQLSLRKLLENFLKYREETVIKRINFELRKTITRLELLEGLIIALKDIRKVINIIEKAKDLNQAKSELTINLKINDKQSDAILSMPLKRLTSLEKKNMYEELEILSKKKNELEILLKDRNKLLEMIIQELKNLKKSFGNKRKTKLIQGGDALIAEKIASQRPNAELQRKQAFDALPNDGKILIQNDNQVRIISPQTLGRLHLNQNTSLGEDHPPAKLIWPISTEPKILAITSTGKIALVKWEFAGQQPGSLKRFLPSVLENENIISLVPLFKNKALSLGLLSSDGRFKRLPIEEVLDLSGRAATIVKLKEGVTLKSAVLCKEHDYIIILTNLGRVLKLSINNQTIPLMGKLAQGSLTMRTLPEEEILTAIACEAKNNMSIIVATKYGQFKKLRIDNIRLAEKGHLGEIAINLKKVKKTQDEVIGAYNSKASTAIISSTKRICRFIEEESLDTEDKLINIPLLNLKEEEYISEFVPLISPEIF